MSSKKRSGGSLAAQKANDVGDPSADELDENVSQNFKVVVRVRPPQPRERNNQNFQNIAAVQDNREITLSENLGAGNAPADPGAVYATHRFTFDHVYGEDSSQSEIYKNTACDVVMSSLQGYNTTIFAYGQTGSGKTYTMQGFKDLSTTGIIPRASTEIFKYISQAIKNPEHKFLVRASYLQIYNEWISDLLKPDRHDLKIREAPKRGVYVEGLSEWVVRSPAEIFELIDRGAQVRATASTRMNEMSSRSHAVFIIIVEQVDRTEGKEGEEAGESLKIGRLNLVDLAGSERVRYSGASGERLKETANINRSLHALGNVISALTDAKKRSHIPYRNSKLTRLLEDSIGGNCKTTMMAMISPALENFSETLSTLKFANRAKSIKNIARVNEDLDQKGVLRKYERELNRLRAALQTKSKQVVDKRKLLELEEKSRRAEEDKMAALNALEQRSREFLAEKQAKRKLEERIAMMNSQLLVGGQEMRELPAFRSAVAEEQHRIHQEYQAKLRQLEEEREQIEEDKAQVDRYKTLLLKQRDIMIALTKRLNERDDSIVALQEELDAYDSHQIMIAQRQHALGNWMAQVKAIAAEKGVALPDLELPGEEVDDANAGENPAQIQFEGYESEMDEGNAPPLFAREAAYYQQAPDKEWKREILDLRAEKVQVESLLREKLEEMVQSEIGRRIAEYQGEGDGTGKPDGNEQPEQQPLATGGVNVDVLWTRLQTAEDEARALKKKLQGSLLSEAGPRSPQHQYTDEISRLSSELQDSRGERQVQIREVLALKQQCATNAKERAALKTIMESKIKVMVDNVARMTADVKPDRPSFAGDHYRITRQVFALQKLVDVSIAAMKNSEKQEARMSASGRFVGSIKLLEKYAGNSVDIVQDRIGNIRARFPSKNLDSKKIMVSAHLDEIGGTVMSVKDNGRVLFTKRGGFETAWLVSQHVLILNESEKWVEGVVMGRTVHTVHPDGRDPKPSKVQDMEIFVGAATKEEAFERLGIHIGSPIVFGRTSTRMLNEGLLATSLVTSSSLDDVLGLVVLLMLAARCAKGDLDVEVNLVASVREEIGLEGGRFAGRTIQPDACIGLDFAVTYEDETGGNGTVGGRGKLGNGPSIVWAEGGGRIVFDYKLAQGLRKTAKQYGISFQDGVHEYYGSDSGACQAEFGIPSVLVAIPMICGHNVPEIANLQDVFETFRLLDKFLHEVKNVL